MITKKNMWFLTLFSIILVMSIYYISYPNNTSLNQNMDTITSDSDIVINNTDVISTLKVERDVQLEKEINGIKDILNDENKTINEKNEAYEALKTLKSTKAKESVLEEKIKNKFNYDSYIKIDGDKIKVVINSSEHSYELASKIIIEIQNEFSDKKYITVTFK